MLWRGETDDEGEEEVGPSEGGALESVGLTAGDWWGLDCAMDEKRRFA